MSSVPSFLHVIWDSTYGLLVDDGQLAVGIVIALVITWAVGAAMPTLRDTAGWLLLVLISALVLANVYRAGRNARRRAI